MARPFTGAASSPGSSRKIPRTQPDRLAIRLGGRTSDGLPGLAHAPMIPRLTVRAQLVNKQPGKRLGRPALRSQARKSL